MKQGSLCRNLLVAVLLCSAVLLPAYPLGRVVSYKEFVAEHFSSIQHAETCGSWGETGEFGTFRFFHAHLYGQSMIFVDMIKLNKSQTGFTVQRGFSIPEVNNDHADISISNLRCQSVTEESIAIHGDGKNGHDGSKLNICIVVDGARRSVSYFSSPRSEESAMPGNKQCVPYTEKR